MEVTRRQPDSRRPSHLGAYFAWVAAWMISMSLMGFVIDWSFASKPLSILVPFVALGWVALAVNVVVQAVRAGRGASIQRRILLASVFPFVFIAEPMLLSIAVGPPSDVALRFEFLHNRAHFDALEASFNAERSGGPSAPVESDGLPLVAAPNPEVILASLHISAVRRPSPFWIELVRWSRVSGDHGVDEGFLFSEVPPDSLVESFDEVPRGSRVYRHLDGCWYLFRGAW